jgi:hypothetical protein
MYPYSTFTDGFLALDSKPMSERPSAATACEGRSLIGFLALDSKPMSERPSQAVAADPNICQR